MSLAVLGDLLRVCKRILRCRSVTHNPTPCSSTLHFWTTEQAWRLMNSDQGFSLEVFRDRVVPRILVFAKQSGESAGMDLLLDTPVGHSGWGALQAQGGELTRFKPCLDWQCVDCSDAHCCQGGLRIGSMFECNRAHGTSCC